MAVATAEEFFDTLDKSDLLSPEQLADARSAAKGNDDPTAIAKVLIRQDLLTRWQAGQLLAGRSSFFLGKYKLIELLGRGGMGNVFLAEHTTMHRRVALKIVSRQVRKDPASLERFLSEARAIAALDHPNIVRAYSVDNEADRYYIVMEHVDGIDLRRMIVDDGPLDYETAADCIRQAADGLAHGHDRNMIHCDIKPSNLLVNEQGVVKIVDMGLTRLSCEEEAKKNEPDDKVLGSVDYLAPEQALESADFDHRADIYSLGCTLYFLLTAQPPFPEGTLHERLMKHQTQPPPSIRKQRPDAPRELVDLCEKMMAKKAEDRPQSAEEISRILADWHPSAPTPSAPLKVAESLEKPAVAGLPSININVAPKASEAVARKEKAPIGKGGVDKAGLLSTGRRKIIGGAVALLVVGVVAAATIALVGGTSSVPDENDQAQAGSSNQEQRQDDTGRQPAAQQQPKDGNVVPEIPRASDAPADDVTTDNEPPDDAQPDDEPPIDQQPDDEPAAAEPLQDEPAADDPPGDEPAEDKPQPKEPEKVDPFGELAAVAELQLLDAMAEANGQPPAAFPLGKLHLASNASWYIKLLGGGSALRGKQRFELKRGGDRTSWMVRLDSQTASGPTDVARIWHENDSLMFRWAKDAAADSANYLRNCALSIHVDNQSRLLRLSRPLDAEPLAIDLIKRVSISKIRGKYLPDPSKLRLEITDFEGEFPKHRLEPQRPITSKERINISLDGQVRHGNSQQLMSFGLEWTVRGDDLTVTLRLLAPHMRLVNFKLQPNEEELAQMRAVLEQAEIRLKKEKDVRTRMQMEFQMNKAAGIIWYGQQCHTLHQKGKIHFRIYSSHDEAGLDAAQFEVANTQRGDKVTR